MNRKNSVLDIKILHSKAETLEKTKAATVEQADNGIERVFEMTQYNINFLPGIMGSGLRLTFINGYQQSTADLTHSHSQESKQVH
jgi:hypothetical protein